VKLMGTIVQVLRFPHRFLLILFMLACIILPMSLIWFEAFLRKILYTKSSLVRFSSFLTPLVFGLFLMPLLVNWNYHETFISGNFKGFLTPYPVKPLKEVKDFLLELPEGKTIVLPPTETAKRIIDINGVEHKFIDKFHIYYLDLPSYYYGLSGDPRNKLEFFLFFRAMYYEQDWWINIARDNEVRYIIINKEITANSVGGAEYLREIEKRIIPQMDQFTEYFRKIFENQSYVVYEFINLPSAERIPLFIDLDWNTFISLQNDHLDLTKYYDLRYGMIVDDLQEFETLQIITDNEEKAMLDVHAKTHQDKFFKPSSTIYAFDSNLIPSTYYLAPMFRMFQFFSDTKWNRLDMITPGMFGTITGGFVGLPRDSSFRIDFKIPETGRYRILLRGVASANKLAYQIPELGVDSILTLNPIDSEITYFDKDKVFSSNRESYDINSYSIEELEDLIPNDIVAVNYQFGYFDLGVVDAKKGSYTVYFDKEDKNPMMVEGILVIGEEFFQNLDFPDNVEVIDPENGICCLNIP